MHKIVKHRCKQCGCSFELPEAPKPSDILTTSKNHIPLEDSTHVTCPSCGHKEWATERKFFGILGPKGLQILVSMIVFGFIVALVVSEIK
jgi:rubredoxin